MTPPDTITVTARHFADIRSAGADIELSVSETGFGARSTGRVSKVRALLADRGFSEDDISLQGVERASWAWVPIGFGIPVTIAVVFFKGSVLALWTGGAFLLMLGGISLLSLGTVTAKLGVRCADGQRVGRVLDLAFAERSVELKALAWRYEPTAAAHTDWVVLAVGLARERADRIAAALGVRIVGVHSFREVSPPTQHQVGGLESVELAEAAPRRARRGSVSESLMTVPSSSSRTATTVIVEYRVALIEAASQGARSEP